MKTSSPRTAAFTLIEIMIVVAIIGFLTAMAIPVFAKARESSRKSTCVSNLRIMDSAITTWALEQHKAIGACIDENALFGTENMIRDKPICPAGGEFKFETVGANPQVRCTFADIGHTLP
jgi:prepilin-type N-terminal cleavage/methylation domain-containing protein